MRVTMLIMCGLLALSPLAHAGRSRSEQNPMRKIIGMLQDMQKEVEREGELEKEIFEKAMCACETGQKELQKTIEDATADSDEQSSTIEAQTSEKAQLAQEVEEHKTSKAQA